MRKFSKHTPEQIVVKLEKAEALRGEGMSTAQVCRVLGISEATLCRWRQRYGPLRILGCGGGVGMGSGPAR